VYSLNSNKRIIKVFNDFFVLFSGSVIGQLIVFVSIPYFTRVYSEEVFGVFALYSSSVATLGLISTLRYELAIMLPKEKRDAVNILFLNFIIVVIISFLLFLVIFLLKDSILSFLKIERIGGYIFLLPFSVLLVGFINAIDSWNNRNGNYKYISTGVVSKSSAMISSQFFTSISVFSSLGLVPGLIIGQVVNFYVSISLSFKTFKSQLRYLSRQRIIYLAKKYADMPRFNTLISFTNTLSNELPIFLFSSFFGMNVVGVYSLAIKVSKVPPGIIGASISKIFFKESTLIYNNNDDLYLFLIKTLRNLFVISILIFSILFIVSYYLNFVFGENWRDVGEYVRILIPWLFFGFIHSSISNFSVILNKQKTLMLVDLIFLILRYISIFVGYRLFSSVIVSLQLFSFVGIIFNVGMIAYYLYIAKYYKRNSYIY